MAETWHVGNGRLLPVGMTFSVRISTGLGYQWIHNCMLFDYEDRLVGPGYKSGRGYKSHVEFSKDARAVIKRKAITLRRRLKNENLTGMVGTIDSYHVDGSQ